MSAQTDLPGRLLARIRKTEPGDNHDLSTHQAWLRRVSQRFADQLRKRGLLVEEGYAPDSWVTKEKR